MGRLPRFPVLQDVNKSLFILNSFLFLNTNWTCLKFRESSGSGKGMGACAGRVLICAAYSWIFNENVIRLVVDISPYLPVH
jgi:hypothetical protein